MGKAIKTTDTGAKGLTEPLAPVDILQSEFDAKPDYYEGLSIKDTAKQTVKVLILMIMNM